jgi:hypothetical protein
MALTLTELMVVPGTGNKLMSAWKITGDGSSYQVTVKDLKMSKIEAAWTENINSEKDVRVVVSNYDYVDGPVDIIELGGDGTLELPITNGAEIVLFVIGY